MLPPAYGEVRCCSSSLGLFAHHASAWWRFHVNRECTKGTADQSGTGPPLKSHDRRHALYEAYGSHDLCMQNPCDADLSGTESKGEVNGGHRNGTRPKPRT